MMESDATAPLHPLSETNRYYEGNAGLTYTDEQVDRWLDRWFFPYVAMKGGESVLDLCCGDGCWSMGLLRHVPDIHIHGFDISESAIGQAQSRAAFIGASERATFKAHNCEEELPVHDSSFDIIFARGLFVFNQHDMTRPGCLELLKMWHKKLNRSGYMVSMYGSNPKRLETYTAPEQTVLPMNHHSRVTSAVDFRGGKFNHGISSFVRPFEILTPHVAILSYQFAKGRHTLISRRVE